MLPREVDLDVPPEDVECVVEWVEPLLLYERVPDPDELLPDELLPLYEWVPDPDEPLPDELLLLRDEYPPPDPE